MGFVCLVVFLVLVLGSSALFKYRFFNSGRRKNGDGLGLPSAEGGTADEGTPAAIPRPCRRLRSAGHCACLGADPGSPRAALGLDRQAGARLRPAAGPGTDTGIDRKSTRLNSSH